MKKLFFCTITSLLFNINLYAQWSESTINYGCGSSFDFPSLHQIKTDAAGNVYAVIYEASSTPVSRANIFKLVNGDWVLRDRPWIIPGGANDPISCLTTDPAGNLYAAGEIRNADGKYCVAINDVVQWRELGTGVNSLNTTSRISALASDASGKIYAGGLIRNQAYPDSFHVAVWNSSNWAPLGAAGDTLRTNGTIRVLHVDAAGNLYTAGDFTDENGFRFVAKWDGTHWTRLGTGANALNANSIITSVATDASGKVYASGIFTNSNNKRYVAIWNGTGWAELGTGANSLSTLFNVYGQIVITTDSFGNVYASGAIRNINFPFGHQVAIWNGYTWKPLGSGNSGPNSFYPPLDIACDASNNIFAGFVALFSGASCIRIAKYTSVLPSATILGDTAICINSSAQNVIFKGSNGRPPYTFNYTVNNGPLQTISTSGGDDTISISTPSGAIDTFTYHLVSFSDSYPYTAAATDSMVVKVKKIPHVTITVTPTTACAGAPIVLSAVNDYGIGAVYQWYRNAEPIIQSGTPVTVNIFQDGDIVTCRLLGNINIPCSESTSNSVTVTITPPNITPSVSIAITDGLNPTCSGLDVTFTATPNDAGTVPSYQWKVNNINQGFNSPTFTYSGGNGIEDVTCVVTPGGFVPYCVINSPVASNTIQLSSYTNTWYMDADGDSYYTGTPLVQCEYPGAGYIISTSTFGMDCDDNNQNVNPGVVEVPANNIDDDCNGQTDEIVYCTPSVGLPCFINIQSVVLNTMQKNDNGCNGGYSDYSGTDTANVETAGAVNFSIAIPDGSLNQHVNIYVDYNSDGDFNDTDEQVVTDALVASGTPATGSFNIPALQPAGSYRLRIVSEYEPYGSPSSCVTTWGEFEDYTLRIAEPVCPLNTWTSAANDGDWNNPANWCTGAVPTGAGNAIIPAANTPYPSLTADAAVNNIVIESGATLSIGAHTLTLNGTVNEATLGSGGTISGSNQSILVATNTTGTFIYFTPGQNLLKNLTVASGAQLFIYGGDLQITAAPIPGKVTLEQFANLYCDNLIFKSGPAGTARLDELPVDGSGNAQVQIQGSQTVERYIPNNNFRSWRLLSVPTHSSGQTIRQAWQEGDANPLPQQNNLAGYGTQITGTGNLATAQAAGFDNVAANAGMLFWNVNAWGNVTNTNTAIDNKKAYFLFVRGERSKGVTGAVSNSSATTLRTFGSLYTGNQSTTVPANSFTVVPNLYASAIDFTGLTRSGVSNLFYIWDSKKLNGSSLGMYQTFSATNSFNCMVSGGSYTLGQPNTLIESGQAFFVQGNSTGGSIILHESSKRNGSTGLGFRPAPSAVSKLETRLYEADGTTMKDAATIVFDAAYTNKIDEEDAPKLGNPGENFAVETDSKILAVEGRKPLKDVDAIQFRMWNLKQQQYNLELAPLNLNTEGLTAMLEDSYLKTSIPVDLTASSTFSFIVDGNAVSSATNRFRIVFNKATPAITNTRQGYTIAPNPVESGIVNVQFKNQPQGKYNVRIISATGQVLVVKAITHPGGSAMQTIALPPVISQGHYKVEIIAPGKPADTISLLVNK